MMTSGTDTIEDQSATGCPEGSGSEACIAAPCDSIRRRDKEATKRALIAAAVEVFARLGYDAATTKEVAATAGVNEGLIQRYFASETVGGKAGLLQAVVGGMCGEKLAACRLAPPGGSLEIEIGTFLKHEIAQAQANRDFMRVLLSRALVDADLAATLKDHYKRSRIPLLVHRLKHFQAAGSIDSATDLEIVAESVITFAFGLAFMQQVVLAEDPQHLDAIIDNLARSLAQGMTGRGSAPPGSAR